jgi:hypothetical protein
MLDDDDELCFELVQDSGSKITPGISTTEDQEGRRRHFINEDDEIMVDRLERMRMDLRTQMEHQEDLRTKINFQRGSAEN